MAYKSLPKAPKINPQVLHNEKARKSLHFGAISFKINIQKQKNERER